jgi:hypothetical protein
MSATTRPLGHRFTWEDDRWPACLITLVLIPLATATTVLLIALAYRSTLRYQINFNEGWNTYWAQRAAQGQPIYAAPGAMVFNNYPPLSFLLVSALTHLGLAPWIIGRGVAWVSFAACTMLIRAILRALGSDGATLGALLFAAVMVREFHDYVGMYDPQLAAHCVMLSGLWLLLRRGGPTRRSVVAAAIVVVIGGFTKHNLLALPVTITFWLALYHRDLLARWLIAAAGSLALGFLLCRVSFGPDFVTGLLAPRVWAADLLSWKLALWLPSLLPAAVVALLPLALPGCERVTGLLALFVAVALAVGCISLGGEGVVYNALFELLIAAALGVGYLVGERVRRPVLAGVALTVAALVASSSVVGAIAGLTYRHDWLAGQQARVAAAQRIVATIAAQRGPILCEDLLLCYWAGKPFEIDAFNYREALLLGRDPAPLLDRIARHQFGAIELNRIDSRLPEPIQTAIRTHYAPAASVPGLFLPRVPPADTASFP